MTIDAQQAEEYFTRGRRLYEAGDLAGACRDLTRGTVHAQRAGRPAPADLLWLLARAYFLLGKFEQARAHLAGEAGKEAVAAPLAWLRGREAEAPEVETGPEALLVGYGAVLAGRLALAGAYLGQARDIEKGNRNGGSPFLRFNTLGWLGMLALHTGRYDAAATLLNRCLRLAGEYPGLTTHLPIFQAARAELVLAGGNVTAAVRLTEEALDLAERTQQPLAQALCQHTLARLVPATPNPDWDAAAEMIQETMLYFEREMAVPLLAVARLQLGLLHAARGETNAAREMLSTSNRHFARLQMPLYQEQARRALSALTTVSGDGQV